MKFAELLNNQDFSGSSGWLTNFKQRYSIHEYSKHGEAQSAPLEQLPEMRRDLQNILKKYQLNDIFNCDETGKWNQHMDCQMLHFQEQNKTKIE